MTSQKHRGRPVNARSKYRFIASDIAKKINSGKFPIGQPLPSWRSLAHRYAVGLMTIRRAIKVLNLEGQVAAMPHHRSVASSGLALNNIVKNTIGVVAPIHIYGALQDTGWTGAMHRGIMKATIKSGWTLLILQDARGTKTYPAGLIHLPLRGLILVACPFMPLLFKQYATLNTHFPVVTLDEPSEYLHSVSLDNSAVIREATLRMIEFGHRKIAFIRPIHASRSERAIDADTHQRTEAFTATCREAGLKSDQYQVFSLIRAGRKRSNEIQNILKITPRFTAILTISVFHAQQIINEVELADLHVPRDVSIVTINDNLPSRWSGPVVNFEEFGIKGVELVCSKPRTLKHITISTSWNVGETLGKA